MRFFGHVHCRPLTPLQCCWKAHFGNVWAIFSYKGGEGNIRKGVPTILSGIDLALTAWGWLLWSTVIDNCTSKIVSWGSHRIRTNLVIFVVQYCKECNGTRLLKGISVCHEVGFKSQVPAHIPAEAQPKTDCRMPRTQLNFKNQAQISGMLIRAKQSPY